MPIIHKKDKKLVSMRVNEANYNLLKEVAKAAGISIGDAFDQLVVANKEHLLVEIKNLSREGDIKIWVIK